MTIADLEAALQELRDVDEIVDVRECEDVSLVDEVEESLGVDFSKELREFHEKYEYLQVEAEEFTWIRSMGHAAQERLDSPVSSQGLDYWQWDRTCGAGGPRQLEEAAVYYANRFFGWMHFAFGGVGCDCRADSRSD